MNKDPNLKEMVEAVNDFARQQEIAAIDIAEGIHNFAVDFNGGQTSNLYAATSAQGFKPGMSGIMSEDGKAIYDELARQFVGFDPTVLAKWNAEQRAARALIAVNAFANARGEVADETDLQDILTDILHLMRLAGRTQEDMGTMMRMAVENFTEEIDEAVPNQHVDATIPPDPLDMNEVFQIGSILSPDFVPVRKGSWE